MLQAETTKKRISYFFPLQKIVVLILVALIVGCASTRPYAPVSDRAKPPAVKWGNHTVRQGETLYSIAWRYGRDFKELASANKIASPFLIHPGQRISLYPNKGNTQKNNPPKIVAQASTSTSQKRETVKSQPKKQLVQKYNNSAAISWKWPLNGKLASRFSASGSVNKGIDIASKMGQPVKAAAQGYVVYSGSGLLGYGKLVIVKHNATFLSAYAHNSQLIVKEGEKVQAGQTIAKVGSTGTDTPKLHFEIRRKGKPVNPLIYLPKR